MSEVGVDVYPRGLKGEFPEGPPTAVVTHRGLKLALRFAPCDFAGEEGLRKLEVLPETDETLEPRALRQFAPQTELYLAYARAAMRLFGTRLDASEPEADLSRRYDAISAAGEILREIGRPGRGLSDEFYRTIALHYLTLIEEGEPHPIKTLGETHHVSISAASRWVKGARERGYLDG